MFAKILARPRHILVQIRMHVRLTLVFISQEAVKVVDTAACLLQYATHLHYSCEVGGRVEQSRKPNTLRSRKILRPRAKLSNTAEHVHEFAQKILFGWPRQLLPCAL